jgi:hypothetical protein
MKKSLKIIGIVLGCILVLMLALPFAFQGKISDIVKSEGNQMLNAKFDFKSLRVSLFKEFPKASISLNDLCLTGQGEFAKDTLVDAGELTAALNLFSLFSDSYDISKIVIKDTRIHAIVMPDGKVNWDIMKSDTTKQVKETKESTPFHLQLKKLVTKNLTLIYDDRKSNMYAEVKDLDASLKGDFQSKLTTIKLNAECPSLTYKMNKIPLINGMKVKAKVNLDADLENSKYTFKDNEIQLNAIKVGIDGWVAKKTPAMTMDLKLKTNDVNFKEILSLIPAIYAKNFKDIKTEGVATLSASAKGIMQGDTVPQFKAMLNVKNAKFQYPSLPSSVDQINVDAIAQNPGGSADLTTITINKFDFRMGNNPFHVAAVIKTPVSDLDFKAEAKGILNLGMIKQVYPLENMTLNGIINANVSAAGKMSYISNEQYDRISASGTIGVSNMTLKMKDIPDISIHKSLLTFTPQFLKLSETTVNVGKNDLTIDSQFSNYLGYALKGTTLKGSLNVKSNHFNLGDFMTGTAATTQAAASKESSEKSTKETKAAASKSSVIVIPKNIDFTLKANMKQVLYQTMTFNNMIGTLIMKDSKVNMKNLTLTTMKGSVDVNGIYSTVKADAPTFDAGLKMNNIGFKEAYQSMNTIKSLAPIFENLKGSFSGNINMAMKMDKQMNPVMKSVNGSGSISTQDVNLSGVKSIDLIATALNKPSLSNMNVKNMKIDFTIKDGRVSTKPFDIKWGGYVLNLSGDTGLDQTINYSGKVKIPESAATIGKFADISTIDLKIGGTYTKPKVSLDTKSMAKQAAKAAASKAASAIGKKIGVDVSSLNKDTIKKKVTEKAASKLLDFLKKKVQ